MLVRLEMVLAWIKEARTDFYYQNARQLTSYETEQEKQISNTGSSFSTDQKY